MPSHTRSGLERNCQPKLNGNSRHVADWMQLLMPGGKNLHLMVGTWRTPGRANFPGRIWCSMGSKELRIYMGYCGWSRGQLENEVNLGGWYIFNGSEGLVFDSNPSTLWSRMIARTELHIAQLQRRFDGRNLFELSSSLALSSSPKDSFPHRAITR